MNAFEGSLVQNAIYIAGQAEWPVGPEDWEAAAETAMDPGAFGYIAGGAGGESTMRANLEAFERHRLRPRMLAGNLARDLTVDVLGTPSAAPFLLAPVGVLSIAHEQAEVGAARGAAATGVPFVLSSAATSTIEAVAEAMGNAPRWFQLYWINDREVAASFVRRAEANGFSAIVVTLDTPILAWRPRDLRNAYLPFIRGEGCGQFFSDPVFRAKLEKTPEEDVLTAAATMLMTFPNLGLTWDDLLWLREQTALPLLVKGVLRGDDAERARERGVDGIVVSNHGGRQVDGAVASLDALLEVRDAVGPDYPLIVDGGIRRGADVIKALALGADAVMIGRLYAYALAVGGAAGVEALIRQLLAEVDLTLALCGANSVRDLSRDLLNDQSTPR
ncbi:MAG: alpha-hydroxy-acid oxidizing protein [Actinobacteria bacterium]|nr:alpha-hydroxy-acid oxidizing protein [Actinomycetota bacterium]MBV8561745.1 alpha-hydroxy-acid oxidizing protein [Actinomycetota bacterium]